MSNSSLSASPSFVSVASAEAAVKPKPVKGTPAVGCSRENASKYGTYLLAGDWLVAAFSIYAGLLFRELWRQNFHYEMINDLTVKPMIYAWSLSGAFIFIWFMAWFRTYEGQNLFRLNVIVKNSFKATCLCAIAVWSIVGFFGLYLYAPRLGVALGSVILLTTMVIWRLVAYGVMIRTRVRASLSSRIIMVGWNPNAERLLNAMRNDMANLSEVIGCIPMPGGRFESMPPKEVPVLGDYSAVRELAQKNKANSVVLADTSCSGVEIEGLIHLCQAELLTFRMVPEYFPALHSGLAVEDLSGVPLLGIHKLPLDRTRNRLLKRVMDIMGACVGLFFTAPIMGFFMTMVYLESPGPVLYRQLRTSRNGRNFYIYKIRSMKVDAEKGTGAVWCRQQDDRRLKIGAFMRKTNVDELPQFWNVLIGDMSLVGPRPERPELIEQFKHNIPNYNARHKVRAGLTGWAQINGWRGDTDLTKRIEADLYYMENWSLAMDIHCMVATFFKVKNAY